LASRSIAQRRPFGDVSHGTLAWDNEWAMDATTTTIVNAILHVSRKSGTLPTRDPAATADALRSVCAEWESHARGLVTPELKESPAWAAYEMKTLELGRALDLLIRKLGLWRGKGDVLDAAAFIIAERRYGRGRKSWIATLGEHGEGHYGRELASVLTDEEMAGYAMKALLRARNGEYAAEVIAAADHARTWVKNTARAYVDSFHPTALSRLSSHE
jgi:hypothetical protein